MAPADVLARAARLTGVRLEWLILGEGARDEPSPAGPRSPVQNLTDRLLVILQRNPQAQRSVEDFLRLLEGMPAEASHRPVAARSADADLIPVLGSTAAGTARYWSEIEVLQGGREADARLEQALSGHFERIEQTAAPVVPEIGRELDRVSLVQFSQPDAEGFLEFVSAPGLRQRHPRAVAWRIDGESMAPRFRDGDLVITSPDHPAVEMQPCVARQADQIGVNCKLFRRDGDDVLLIPVNEAYPVQRIPAAKIVWAWRVLSSIRLFSH